MQPSLPREESQHVGPIAKYWRAFLSRSERATKRRLPNADTTYALASILLAQDPDWRNIRTGRVIPTFSYADQPYVVKTDDGAWLCIVTTGAAKEGAPGQTVAVCGARTKASQGRRRCRGTDRGPERPTQ